MIGISEVTKKIKAFPVDGQAIDIESIVRIRTEVESRIVDDMRERGYVPVMDITPELYTDYDEEQENFRFAIIVYGTYLGKARARKVMGILGQHHILFEDETN